MACLEGAGPAGRRHRCSSERWAAPWVSMLVNEGVMPELVSMNSIFWLFPLVEVDLTLVQDGLPCLG